MTVAETLAALKSEKDIEPSADYAGEENTDDFILAIQTDKAKQTKESAWIVCADHVKEHSGSLNASTTDEAFIRTGKGETGNASLIVTSDVGGSANAPATFAVDVKAVGTPKDFNYLTDVTA